MSDNASQSPSSNRLLLPDETCERVRLSRPTVDRLRRRGEFPAPIVLGRKRIAYIESEVESWIENRKRAAYCRQDLENA